METCDAHDNCIVVHNERKCPVCNFIEVLIREQTKRLQQNDDSEAVKKLKETIEDLRNRLFEKQSSMDIREVV